MIKKIISGLVRERVQILQGPRHVGKHYEMRKFYQYLKEEKDIPDSHIFQFDFDDILTRLEFTGDLADFQNKIEAKIGSKPEKLADPIYLIVEQIQNATNLLEFLAILKKSNPKMIHLLITSSVNLGTDPGFKKHLASISDVHFLYPLGMNRLIEQRITSLNGESVVHKIFKSEFDISYFQQMFEHVESYKKSITNLLNELVLFGGLPGIVNIADREKRWQKIRDYLRTFFERDLVFVYQATDLKKFNQILHIMSTNNGNILNLLKMCDDYGINRNTMRKYIGILSDTFMIDLVPPFKKERVDKPVMSTPKFYFLNSGFLNYLNGNLEFNSLEFNNHFQTYFDNMLFVNLKSTMAYFNIQGEMTFLRDYQNHELDFLISTPNGLVPVGISNNRDTRNVKIKTFRYYLRYCQQIYHGVIFGNFDKIECLEMKGSKLFLLPHWMIW